MPKQPARGAETSLELRNNRDDIAALQARVVEQIERHDYPKSARFAVLLALEEAIANAFQHGHRDLPEDLPISVCFSVSESDIYIAVQDQGSGFDPGVVPDPTLEENIASPSCSQIGTLSPLAMLTTMCTYSCASVSTQP